jgi:hypothetical protein
MGTFRDGPHRAEQITEVLSFWRHNYLTSLAALQAFAGELTRPDTYAAAYDDIDRLVSHVAGVSPRFSGDDVTILMCTHNDADLAEEAICSVAAQTTKVREIVVVDDGSSNPVMCERLDRLTGERVRSGTLGGATWVSSPGVTYLLRAQLPISSFSSMPTIA